MTRIEEIETALQAFAAPFHASRVIESMTRKGEGLALRMLGFDLEIYPAQKPSRRQWDVWQLEGGKATRCKIHRRHSRGRTEAEKLANDCEAVCFHLQSRHFSATQAA